MKINSEQLVKVINFWQENAKKETLKDREIVSKIDYRSREIVDIVGPRRSGKSSVLKLIIKNLGLKDNFLIVNFEDPFFINNNQPEIIEELIDVFKEYFNSQLKYLFFDEIQQINQWERVVRKLRDGAQYKIFVTGSSSKLLSSEIASLLTGRHLSYFVLPLSFKEFLSFKEYPIKDKKSLILKEKALIKHFKEYLEIGGFPEVVLKNNKELLKNYFFDILERDIVMRHDIREKSKLERMAIYFLTNASKTISIESLKNTFNISYSLANSFWGYLKESFLIFELPQFSYSLKKQEKAFKKIYSIDTGLSNAVSFKFSEDQGRVLENVVFLELKRQKKDIYYYKTKNNLEIDFLLKEKEQVKELIQVSWSLSDQKTKEREVKALIEAMKENNLKKGLIITSNEEGEIKEKNAVISIKPAYKWLQQSD